MFRTPFAIMAFMSFSAMPVLAQTTTPESASDATTIMDKEAGNQTPPTDNTLSNSEVKHLQEGTGGDQETTGAMGTVTGGTPVPSVSGTTPSYEDKGGSAAKTEGQ
jgi:hypothetical protein